MKYKLIAKNARIRLWKEQEAQPWQTFITAIKLLPRAKIWICCPGVPTSTQRMIPKMFQSKNVGMVVTAMAATLACVNLKER